MIVFKAIFWSKTRKPCIFAYSPHHHPFERYVLQAEEAPYILVVPGRMLPTVLPPPVPYSTTCLVVRCHSPDKPPPLRPNRPPLFGRSSLCTGGIALVSIPESAKTYYPRADVTRGPSVIRHMMRCTTHDTHCSRVPGTA